MVTYGCSRRGSARSPSNIRSVGWGMYIHDCDQHAESGCEEFCNRSQKYRGPRSQQMFHDWRLPPQPLIIELQFVSTNRTSYITDECCLTRHNTPSGRAIPSRAENQPSQHSPDVVRCRRHHYYPPNIKAPHEPLTVSSTVIDLTVTQQVP